MSIPENDIISPKIIKTNLLNYAEVSITDNLNRLSKKILLFPNMEYIITFFNDNTYIKQKITALITNIYNDQIKVSYFEDEKNTEVDKDHCPIVPHPCNCVFSPPNINKYNEPNTIFIPFNNIIDIEYVKALDQVIKEDIIVMLVGISAEIVKAIVVNLHFFEDSINDAIKYIELKKDGVYDLTYESVDGVIFESRVKIIKIEEVDNCCECNSNKGFVRENIGCGNVIYIDNTCTKDDFFNQPNVRKIKIIVDTSETFEGRYEVIMLDKIRDVKVVDGMNDNDFIITIDNDFCKCCNNRTELCNPNICEYYHTHCINDNEHCVDNSNTYKYTFDNMYKACVSGEEVNILVKGENIKLSLNELIKYYLGID